MDISFKRMPNIEFGKADRDKQVMDLLLEMAPVTNTDLADAYEKQFGVWHQLCLPIISKNL